jgi:hypothetical protein
MSDTPGTPKAGRRRGSWRHRENRASPKSISKRVSVDEHKLITDYANALEVSVAELLAPAVEDLLARAREHHDGRSATLRHTSSQQGQRVVTDLDTLAAAWPDLADAWR